ncbi:acetyl-CoA synthetase-like protein [Cadophora sp. DSE1049]|nr:acetyl-CoA synthetase-like protein [Cadophora sp. DSE1049]
MAHLQHQVLDRPERFNFAIDVVDYWARQPGKMEAMRWLSTDETTSRVMTFEYFSRQSHRISTLLDRLGVKRGDTMIMVAPRVPAWWEIAVSAIRSGITLAPATTLVTSKDIEYRCTLSRASVFVGDRTSVGKFLGVHNRCPLVKTVIQVEGIPWEGAVSLYASLESVEENATVMPVRQFWHVPALIYFTSGTSGPPKMVQHNQISFPLALTNTGKYWYQLSPGKLFWNTAEQGWGKAAWSFFGAWNCGATLFVYDDRGPFDPNRLLRILHSHPITTLCAAPLAYRHLVLPPSREYFEKHRPMSLTHCTAAGEALNSEVMKQFWDMAGLKIHDGYGQSETILLCGNFAGCPIRPGSMGKPAPGVLLHVVNSDGTEATVGDEGDMAVLLSKNPAQDAFFGIFDGYVSSDGRVTRNLQSTNFGGQQKRWYRTGDRAKKDEDGYFWFVGRADDQINSSGYRIGPFEVESALQAHPEVEESAVVSSPDPVRGEVVKAFVVLKEASTQDHESLTRELQEFCKRNTAPYKYPRKIQFVPASFIPRTTSGKIQRSKLKKMEWESGTKAML